MQYALCPKVVFQYAFQLNAVAIILCHNHPSGSLKPSETDRRLTRKIDEAGKLMDLRLLDHIVLTSGGYVQIE